MARVRRVGALERPSAGAVVGQRQVDFAGLGIDRGPLGPVHRGRADRVGGEPGVHQHVSLAREGVRRIGAGRRPVGHLSVHQRQPGAGAVSVKLRDMERSGVEVLVAHGKAIGGLRIGRVPRRARDELVEILAPRIVAHVNRQLAAGGQLAHPGALVSHPAKRGAFPRRAVRVVRIDLDYPAEGVRLVAVVGERGGPGRARIPTAEHRIAARARPGVVAG